MTEIKFVLNGENVTIDVDPTKRLLDVLREDFGLTGVKEGCGEGECGACSVLVDNEIVSSCLMPVGNAIGKDIVTIDGFSKTERYRVIHGAYEDEGAVQCGFCIPGMVIATESLLNKNPNPTEEEIRDALSGNLCRCTGYNMIVTAVLRAAERGRGLW
ncbi:MAG TPA: (2Fe-2S)-binding protein [Clostridia bacterium]|nr:(2Fe-2S)-binding protein [Clostridia bacterium]HPQ45925.1 (2Fe-2S)-binding protein [Clostridia bacterium]HRX41242.1 (2Fe-2S)-binding protein [Clostridia bacterium]